MEKKDEIQKKLEELEKVMQSSGFWDDKRVAQEVVQEYNDLKAELAGEGKYDKGGAVITIFGGAGGLDAEDFAHILTEMYLKYIEDKGWDYRELHKNQNDHGGYRNITFEVEGKGVYGALQHESGVHRLVRISPFNAKQQRHTSFAMVEVVPKFDVVRDNELSEDDLEVHFARSGGPGGQNVNKRDTAVRITHMPTGLKVHVSSERTQARNKETAMNILRGKLFKLKQEQQKEEKESLSISKTTEIEWGNQIRSYVLHPYKMVKDHRTDVEVRDIKKVLEDGAIQPFIDAFS